MPAVATLLRVNRLGTKASRVAKRPILSSTRAHSQAKQQVAMVLLLLLLRSFEHVDHGNHQSFGLPGAPNGKISSEAFVTRELCLVCCQFGRG